MLDSINLCDSSLYLVLAMLMALPAIALSMAYTPNDRVLSWLRLCRDAWRMANIEDKEAAYIQGVDHSQLCRQLALRDQAHPSLARFGAFNDEVRLNLAQGICDHTGKAILVRDERLQRLIVTVETLGDDVVLEQKRRAS